MKAVNADEAEIQFARLLESVEAGEEVVIVRDGEPIARLVPFGGTICRTFGVDRGVFMVPDDFDAPLAGVIDEFGA